MMVVNAEKGQNGKFVIQFSFRFLLSSFQTRSCLRYHAVGSRMVGHPYLTGLGKSRP